MQRADRAPHVLIVLGHPRTDSLSYALGRAYEKGARAAGAAVQRLPLATMDFELNVMADSPRAQAFEDDIRRARRLIRWADHLVFVYPTWWGTVPALLKGFLDRVLTAGFAFNEVEGGTGYEGLLTDKSAQLITTMDTPRWVYRWLYGKPGHNAMRHATLRFCGVWPVRVSAFGPVRSSTRSERRRWLKQVRRLGEQLRGGVLSRWDRLRRKAWAWFKAIRLQFYPMTWMAYTIGALAAPQGGFNLTYGIGYLFLFALEAATVLSNDYFDVESDRKNRYYSPFTGGSRVLVEGELRFGEMRIGIGVALALTAVAVGLLVVVSPASAASTLGVAGLLSVLAIGYTVPPLKLSHRGLGEVDVGITHSLGAILAGYVFQGGAWHDALPWLLSVPLFLAVLPAITLAGIPDYEADRAAGKKTLAVRLGRRGAARLAMGLTAGSAVGGVLGQYVSATSPFYGGLAVVVLPHAALLLVLLHRYLNRPSPKERIDRLIALALAYILWFGLVPLFHLFSA